MITFNQVSKRYLGGIEALSQVNFHLKKGEMALLTGHSGSGKSTLLKLISKLEIPTAGQIVVNGVQLNQLKNSQISKFRSKLGIIFQSAYLLNDRTVFDNVAMPLQIQGYSKDLTKKRVQTALDMVGLLNKQKMNPLHLSGGEQQRISIARAIVHKPDLLLADEPTGNLDHELAIDIFKLFSQLNQAGVTVLIATHDLALIAKLKHGIFMLKGGRLYVS